MKNWSKRGVA